eukprot:jgi/Tetstr1/422625/TSEL_013431.t1
MSSRGTGDGSSARAERHQRRSAEKEARAHGSLDADPRRLSSQFTAASTQHTTRGASAFRPPRMAAIEEECDAHMAAAIRTYKLGGEAAEDWDFCGSDSSEESEEGGAGEGPQQLIPPTPPGAVRVACCAPTCRNSIYGRMSLFTGVQATHGGSQHQCAFCEGHFHAFCGATDTETPGAPECEADDDLQAPDSREGHYEEPDFVVAADCDDDDDDAEGGGNGDTAKYWLYAWCFSSHESVGISQALLRQVPDGAARDPFQSGDSAPYKDPPVPAGHRSVTR